MKRNISISVIISLILLAGLVWATTAKQETAVAQNNHTINSLTSATGSITGTVTDGINPLPNILVEVFHLLDPITDIEASTYTDSNGYYEFTMLEDRTYIIKFSDDSNTYVSEYYDDIHGFDLYSAQMLQISGGNTFSNIDAVLTLSGHITGRVTDAATGDPISGIPVGGTITDSDGYYILHNILPGTHAVSFGVGYGPRIYIPQDSAPFDVALGETVTNIDASMVEGGHITGRVTAEDNTTPLENIRVTISENYGGWMPGYDVTTNANGEYQFNGLWADNYRLCFFDESGLYQGECYANVANINSATDIPVVLGQTTANINASLAMNQLPPLAVPDSVTTGFNTPIVIDVLANDSDPNGDLLTLTAVDTPNYGTASIFGSKVIYAPYLDYIGLDTFSYYISDGQGGSDFATVTVTVANEQQIEVDPIETQTVIVETADYDLTIDIPANALPSEANTLIYRSLDAPTSPSPNQSINIHFALTLLDAVDQEIQNPVFDPPLSLTVQYDPAKFPSDISENDIQVYFFDTSSQTWEPIPVVSRNPDTDSLVVELSHFTEFILTDSYHIFIPLVIR